jgi:histidine ammonia-lyase
MTASADWLAAGPHADVLLRKWAWLSGRDAPEDRTRAVRIFIEDHCAAVGEILAPELVRALMVARANVLATGATGARPAVVDTLLAMLAADVVPVVPSIGPVGAAGSAVLAHVAQVACGYGGEAWRDGRCQPAAEAMAGLPVLVPTEKDALSLINGSTYAVVLAAFAVERSLTLLHTFDEAAALSCEVVRADLGAFSERVQEARHHPGGLQVAAFVRDRVAGSSLVSARRRPDAFSIRCIPAVHGAAWDAYGYVASIVTRELNAAMDNPLVFPGHGVIEAGAFHGAPVGLAADHLKVALTQLAGISERRVFRLTYAQLSGLPSFLVPDSGVNSGLMLAQYTAASVVSEAKAMCQPASVDSVPVVQHHEDHVSMASVAARSALRVVDLVADVAAIELLCGAQGLDLRRDRGESAGAGTRRTWERVRQHVDRWVDDRELHPDLAVLGSAVRSGFFVGE